MEQEEAKAEESKVDRYKGFPKEEAFEAICQSGLKDFSKENMSFDLSQDTKNVSAWRKALAKKMNLIYLISSRDKFNILLFFSSDSKIPENIIAIQSLIYNSCRESRFVILEP